MGLKKLAGKLDTYKARLEKGDVSEIRRDHVEKVLTKLRKKASDLEHELAVASSEEKKARLRRKLDIARTHIDRAGWLLNELD